ncbi:MAG TPA: xanthine dehydrogenase family protein subunit M [Vicinamibacterales bacterium]|jgi:xanthine dehydrogenase YagS FAD-binding subunit|nr:xanthine dehydrogenase family protein subunit M [Vicinamibacterales bacterium]
METFEYVRVNDVAEAVAIVTSDPTASYLAGGTTQVDLMRDGVLAPRRLIDLTRLPLRSVNRQDGSLRIGALTTMEELAADSTIRDRVPVIREALLLGASTQLRNMATIGGNLLQRTRCRYFRDPMCACNKRARGTGCSAMDGHHRMHAILGTSEHCFATHGSDLAVALVALDTVVRVRGVAGERAVPLTAFYHQPGDTPDVEHELAHGELIVSIDVPLPPPGARSHYVKVRDRASYEFALASAAVMLSVKDGVIREGRIGLGGVATVPWRARNAETLLAGAPARLDSFQAAADAALEGATPRRDNAFKVELAKRTLIRALTTASGQEA